MNRPDLQRQIACIEREIAIRSRTYPGFVASGRMRHQECEAELDAMRAVLHTLKALPRKGALRRLLDLASELDEVNHADRGEGEYVPDPALADAKAAIDRLPDGIPQEANAAARVFS